jgi:hypothetical protein
MSGLGGVGGAGQDLISSCSSMSYSGDDFETDFPKADGEKMGFEGVMNLLRSAGHWITD